MDFSTESLDKIKECGKRMMTPKETALYLGYDEIAFQDEVGTAGTEARRAFYKGVMSTVYDMREGLLAAANAGSPFALSQSEELFMKVLSESIL